MTSTISIVQNKGHGTACRGRCSLAQRLLILARAKIGGGLAVSTAEVSVKGAEGIEADIVGNVGNSIAAHCQ